LDQLRHPFSSETVPTVRSLLHAVSSDAGT
jgi:hypothetical protein